MNVLEAFAEEATARGDQTAIITGASDRIGYTALWQRSARLASAWKRKGIRAGDCVLLAMPLGIELYASLIGLWRLAATVVFPEPALGLKGLRHAVTATKPRALLASGGFQLLVYALPDLWRMRMLSPYDDAVGTDEIVSVGTDHPALISFTSGSTGRPKTISRSHGFLTAQNACVANMLRSDQDEIDLVAFPVFVLANLGLGMTSVLPNWNLRHHDRASSQPILHHIIQHKVTQVLLPPSICEKMTQGTNLPLRAIFTGGGPVFPDLLKRLAEKAPKADIISVYGSTEAEPIAHQRMADISDADWQAMREGAGLLAGYPISKIALQIRNDEIIVTGEHVNKSYLNAEDNASTKLCLDGRVWHRTGDAGRFDTAGRLWLLGRMDGRANELFPFAIEAAARCWPHVGHAALIEVHGKPVLAVEGDSQFLHVWQKQAERFGEIRVVAIKKIPLDRRHRSKIDYRSLKKILNSR